MYFLCCYFNSINNRQKNSNLELRTSKIAIVILCTLFYPYPFGGPYLSFARFRQCSVFYSIHSGGPYLSFAKFHQCPVFFLLTVVVRTSLSLDFNVFFRSHTLNALAFFYFQLPRANFYSMRIIILSCAMESPPIYFKILISK